MEIGVDFFYLGTGCNQLSQSPDLLDAFEIEILDPTGRQVGRATLRPDFDHYDGLGYCYMNGTVAIDDGAEWFSVRHGNNAAADERHERDDLEEYGVSMKVGDCGGLELDAEYGNQYLFEAWRDCKRIDY